MASPDDNAIDFQAKVQELNVGIDAYQRKAIPLLKKSKNEGDPLSETIENYIKTMENAKGQLKDLMQSYNSLDDSGKQRLYGMVKETLTVSSSVFESIKEKIDFALSVVVPCGSGGSSHQETVIKVPGLRSSIEAYERKITDFMKSKKDRGSSAGIEKLKKDLEDVNRRLNQLAVTDSLSDYNSKKKKQQDEKINDVLKMLNSQFEKTRDDIDLALEVDFVLSEITTGSGGSNHQETLIGVSQLNSSIKAYERKIIDFLKRKKDGGSSNSRIEKAKKDLEDVKGRLNEIIMTDSLSDDDSKKEKQGDEKLNDVLKMLNSHFEKIRDEIDFVVEVGFALSDITTGTGESSHQETDLMKTKKKGGSKKKGKGGSKKR